MLWDSLSYPTNSSDWIPTILIGGVLTGLLLAINVVSSLVPFVWIFTFVPCLLINAIVLGYGARVMTSAAKREDTPPSFVNWGSLIVDGLKMTLVGFAYVLVVLVPILVFALAVGISYSAVDPSSGSNLGLGIVTLLGLGVIGVLSLVVSYVAPASYVNFAIEDSLSAAFDFSTIWSAITSAEYLKTWLLVVVLSVVLGLLGLALSALVVGIFVLFYLQVTIYYLFGRGFAAGLAKKRRGIADANF